MIESSTFAIYTIHVQYYSMNAPIAEYSMRMVIDSNSFLHGQVYLTQSFFSFHGANQSHYSVVRA